MQRFIFSTLFLLLLIAGAEAQTTWHVDVTNCPGPGTGTVADPFCSIQDGINAVAVAGDEVLVAPGTYNELINFLGKAVTVRSSGGRDVTIIDAGPVVDPGACPTRRPAR